jgi:hypothetical protein
MELTDIGPPVTTKASLIDKVEALRFEETLKSTEEFKLCKHVFTKAEMRIISEVQFKSRRRQLQQIHEQEQGQLFVGNIFGSHVEMVFSHQRSCRMNRYRHVWLRWCVHANTTWVFFWGGGWLSQPRADGTAHSGVDPTLGPIDFGAGVLSTATF